MNYINGLKENDKLCGVYLIKDKKTMQTKSGSNYFSITLADKTGTLETRIWDTEGPNIGAFEKMDYVGVKGHVQGYNGTLQGNVNWIKVAPADSYDVSDYVPVSLYPIKDMKDELIRYITSVKNDYMNRLLKELFMANEEAFSNSGAASSVHHAFVGGLLQHTLEVTRTVDFFAKSYPILNRDLVVSAAILHDIGKVREFTSFPENAYSDEGNLESHIAIGYGMVYEAVRKIPNFPKEIEMQIEHCILSHHGQREWGALVEPKTPEAWALHLADNTSAKMEAFTELFEGESEDGSNWYNCRPLGGRVMKPVI